MEPSLDSHHRTGFMDVCMAEPSEVSMDEAAPNDTVDDTMGILDAKNVRDNRSSVDRNIESLESSGSTLVAHNSSYALNGSR